MGIFNFIANLLLPIP